MAVPETHYSWTAVNALADKVATQIGLVSDLWIPEQAIVVARGGLIPAAMIQYRLKNMLMDWKIIGASSYGDGRVGGDVEIITGRKSLKINTGCPTLIIDDLVDTGSTIKKLLQVVPLRDYRVATLLAKEGSKITPNYTGNVIPDTDWVVFPWEPERPAAVVRHHSV